MSSTEEREVVSTEMRKLTRIGCSNHVSIPRWWIRFFNAPVLELKLVRTGRGSFVIEISKPAEGEDE